MARYGVTIEKSVSFRGGVQHFSNTYYFEAPVPSTADVTLNDLVDDLIAIERPKHANLVTFTRARLWSQEGSPAQNTMLVDRALSGTGTSPDPDPTLDRERAFLLQIRAGSDSRGRAVYLRKWFHLMGGIAAQSIDSGQKAQTSQLTTQQRNAIAAMGDAIQNIEYTAGQTWDLVSKSGRQVTGASSCHPWMEHHQLGEEWREA